MTDNPKIAGVLDQWAKIGQAAQLSPEEAINAASEWLATAIMCCIPSERQAHEILNSSNESGHLFINQNWPAAAMAQRMAQAKRG